MEVDSEDIVKTISNPLAVYTHCDLFPLPASSKLMPLEHGSYRRLGLDDIHRLACSLLGQELTVPNREKSSIALIHHEVEYSSCHSSGIPGILIDDVRHLLTYIQP